MKPRWVDEFIFRTNADNLMIQIMVNQIGNIVR